MHQERGETRQWKDGGNEWQSGGQWGSNRMNTSHSRRLLQANVAFHAWNCFQKIINKKNGEPASIILLLININKYKR